MPWSKSENKSKSISLERRLVVYWVMLAFCILILAFMVLNIAGVFANDSASLSDALEVQQKNSTATFTRLIGNINAQNINLSEQISAELRSILREHGDSFEDINDNQSLIYDIEYSLLYTILSQLESNHSSGVFFVLDATRNTQNTARTRMGLYLRNGNLGTDAGTNQYILYFRGDSDIARSEDIALHGRWNMEFDTTNLPAYDVLMSLEPEHAASRCYLTDRITLNGTWEDVVFLCTPILLDGNVVGICGVELSELFIHQTFDVIDTSYGNMLTVIGPREGNQLMLDSSISGKTDGTYFTTTGSLLIGEGEYYNTYSDGSRTYLGTQLLIPESSVGRNDMMLLTLVPQISFIEGVNQSRITLAIISIVFIALMIIAILILSRRFMLPIKRQLVALQNIEKSHQTRTGIIELDELIVYMHSRKERPESTSNIPASLEEMFIDFAKKVETLTPMERTVLQHYIAGLTIEEIAQKEFISIGTVRKHNTNINRKLEVSTREELLLYIDMFRRCDLMDHITYTKTR